MVPVRGTAVYLAPHLLIEIIRDADHELWCDAANADREKLQVQGTHGCSEALC